MPIVKDPVCGTEVDTDAVNATAGQTASGATQTDPTKGTKRFHDGRWFYFDSLACRVKFMANPDEYVGKQ